MMNSKKALFFLFIASTLVSCGSKAKYYTPALDIPENWRHKLSVAGASYGFDFIAALNDPYISQLLETAYCQNPDLQASAFKVLEAKKAYQKALLPAQKKPLKALYEAEVAGYYDAKQNVSYAVLKEYITLRGMQQRLEVSNKNIEAQKEVVTLSKSLVKTGIGNTPDQEQLQAQMEYLEAQKPLIIQEIEKSMNQINILVGDIPGKNNLAQTSVLSLLPTHIVLPTPACIIENRFDIIKAEWEWEASVASCDCIKANQAFYHYQKTVLNAFAESENAISAFNLELERHKDLVQMVEANSQAYELTFQLYKKGLKDFIAVLNVQRALMLAQEAALQSHIQLLNNYAALYKNFGF